LICSQVIAAALKESSKGIKRITAAENYVQLAKQKLLVFFNHYQRQIGRAWKRSVRLTVEEE
jgi:hypothetical protein